jgi:hypothetical protein
MNLATRCFGHHHLPNEIAMCPLVDLINHNECQEKIQFYLTKAAVNAQMIEISLNEFTNVDLEKDLYACINGFMQEDEPKSDERSNLHEDEYPN